MLKTKMAKDPNFDIPVQGNSYSGSDRAKKASGAAHQGPMHKPMVGESPTATATQTDNGPKPADSNDSLKQSSNPKVLNTATKPAAGATPPDRLNPQGRPGLGASNFRKGRF